MVFETKKLLVKEITKQHNIQQVIQRRKETKRTQHNQFFFVSLL